MSTASDPGEGQDTEQTSRNCAMLYPDGHGLAIVQSIQTSIFAHLCCALVMYAPGSLSTKYVYNPPTNNARQGAFVVDSSWLRLK